MTNACRSLFPLALAVLVAGCGPRAASPPASGPAKPVVFASNYPLKYFAERIGGNVVDVRFPVPAGEDPAFWTPTAEQIGELQAADLILLNGATYEKWLATTSLPMSKLVDTSAAFRDRLLQIESATTHSHGPGGKHAHTGTAFTTWLDFQQAAAQADAILGGLVKLVPAQAESLRANAALLRQDLDELDAAMQDAARSLGSEPLVASHPVYQYWARRYGLNVRAVMWEPAIVPDAAALADLQHLLAEHPAKLMIWEAPPAPPSQDLLRSLGLRSLVFAPCSNAPEHGDFLSVMQANLAGLRDAVQDNPRSRVRP